MEILDKVVGREPILLKGVLDPVDIGEPDPMEEVNRKLAEAGRALSWGLSEAVEAIGL